MDDRLSDRIGRGRWHSCSKSLGLLEESNWDIYTFSVSEAELHIYCVIFLELPVSSQF